MKLLKIENQEGYYLNGSEYKNIDSITKEDILRLLKTIYEEENIELDEIDDASNRITMPSQKLVYEKLYEKLAELKAAKEEIIASVSMDFKEAKERYCQGLE
ncbi:MAG: hypothetical protein WC958_03010 [Dehalococcoidales bacterium]